MSRYDILVTRRLPEAGMKSLAERCDMRLWKEDGPASRDWIMDNISGVEGLVCLLSDPMGREVLEAAGDNLRAVSTMAVGYDNIDVAWCTGRGIFVGHTPGVLTEATADLTWALILSVGRRIVEGDRMMREGRFKGWGPTMLVGADFSGKTIGIVGMGRIGKAVARRALGFSMKVLYHNRNRLPKAEEKQYNATYAEIDELVERADFISLHCPLNDQSRHLINKERIARMKSTAYVVNVARGPVVDESALVQALDAKKIAGAAFDVYEKEPNMSPGLAELDNVVLAPHLGSASIETRDKMAEMAAKNLIEALGGNQPPWCVNPKTK